MISFFAHLFLYSLFLYEFSIQPYANWVVRYDSQLHSQLIFPDKIHNKHIFYYSRWVEMESKWVLA